MRRCAQSGLELMAYISFSLLIFSAFYLGILKKDINVINRQEEFRAAEISERIAFELSLAKSSGDGYSRNISLYEDIYGQNYSIRIGKGMVLIDVKNKTYSSHTISSNISGSILPGCNSLSNVKNNVSIARC